MEECAFMIKMLGRVDRDFILTLSGGVDSMVALDFLAKRNRNVLALHFDHGTEYGARARSFVEEVCLLNNIPLVVGSISRERDAGESKEAYWREQRYSFFDSWDDGRHSRVVDFDNQFFKRSKIVTCHHLDDAVETYLFSSIRGNAKLIPYARQNYIRPFLLTKKSEIIEYANRQGVQWLDDPSNANQDFARNFIRHTLLPNALQVNPGLHKTVKKKILAQYEAQQDFEYQIDNFC
jgi:tRNA(Ile)-lysidine synthase